MSEARISAVIIAYNLAGYIGEAIESVLAQTRLPEEIVVIDDGSTDKTCEVVSRYQEAGVRCVRQANQGAGGARNTGIYQTTGDLIAFLDGDDLWLPEKIQRQLEIFEAFPQVGLVSGQAWWWNVETDQRWLVPVPLKSGSQARRDILVRNWIGNPSLVMLRRWALDRAGLFDPALRWGEDWEMWIRVMQQCEVAVLPQPLIVYRSHPSNLSHTRRWESLAHELKISRRAIEGYTPAWQRPILLARAWSHITLQRARYVSSSNAGQSNIRFRRDQAWYTVLSLLTDPFEEGGEKIKLLARALAGEEAYQWTRRSLHKSDHRPHW